MCGEAACAFSASGLSHFSITTKVSGPNLAWKLPMPSASIAGPYSMQPFSACTVGMLAWNSLRIASRMPDLAVMIATTWIMSFPSGDAFKDAVVAARQERADLGHPVAVSPGLFPGRAFQHVGGIELVDCEVLLHPRHGRVLEPVSRRRAHPRHFRQHRKMLGVVDPVELGLVLGRDVELNDKDVGHVTRSAGRCCADGLSCAA